MLGKSLTLTGTGSPAQFSTTSLKAKWVQIVTPPTNAATVYVGGAEITASSGFPIPVGWSGQLLPPLHDITAFYDLTQQYFSANAGDKIDVLYGT